MEPELVARAQHGDIDAFTALVGTRIEAMARTAMAIIGDEADARDATQEALVAIWRELPALRDVDRFDPWATRILVNACRRTIKRRARTRLREIRLDAPTGDGHEYPNPDAQAPEDTVDELEALERAFDRLTAEQRSVLVLHHLEDLPVAEIAVRLGVPAGTVKSRLFTARRALELALGREAR